MKNKLFIGAVALVWALNAIMFSFWLITRDSPVSGSQSSQITGWAYAVDTHDYYGYYYTRTANCINENLNLRWAEASFGIDSSKYDDVRCVYNG